MKKTKVIMGMPITVEIVGDAFEKDFKRVFDYFRKVDGKYSTYKENSEISKINNGLPESKWSQEMKEVMSLCDQTRKESLGYFNIMHNGKLDPSGLVKGWAIDNAAEILRHLKITNFCIEAGGDIQANGEDANNKPWAVGIRNPFNIDEIIKILKITSEGVATSGTYIRGQHIYNPHNPKKELKDVKSLTVVGKNIYEADRFVTAAFAMGKKGIEFIESISGLEGYMVTMDKVATFTPGFERYVVNA